MSNYRCVLILSDQSKVDKLIITLENKKRWTELIKKKKHSTMGDTHDVQFKGVGGW